MDSKKIEGRRYTSITIPAPLFVKIKKSIENTGFSSVSDYCTFVLRETLVEMNKKSKTKGAVIRKLEALGYFG